MCNGVVANRCYFVSHTSRRLIEALERERVTPVLVDTSEFERSGGSVFCLKTFLD
jgi:N-dimethylarginine dimethylaminohydrolase